MALSYAGDRLPLDTLVSHVVVDVIDWGGFLAHKQHVFFENLGNTLGCFVLCLVRILDLMSFNGSKFIYEGFFTSILRRSPRCRPEPRAHKPLRRGRATHVVPLTFLVF